MAYRRRHGITRSTTFKEEIHYPPSDDNDSPKSMSATKASEAHHDSPFSSACGESAFAHIERNRETGRSKSFAAYGDNGRDSKSGFWGVLARKAKAIIEDENAAEQFENESQTDSPLNHDPEGLAMEGNNKSQESMRESWKLQVKRKGNLSDTLNESLSLCGNSSLQRQIQQQNQTIHETQLKASRDVAMATAAKAKLLLRELKTVKADLAFAKLRCSQLEEENKVLREGREKGGNAADDDLIRLQLEALLAEKARLAHESETYARENRFLREIVEYHQLTMQDVAYLNDDIEEEEEEEEEKEENNEEAHPIQQQVIVSTPSSPPREEKKKKIEEGHSDHDNNNNVSQKTNLEEETNSSSFTMKEDQKRPSMNHQV